MSTVSLLHKFPFTSLVSRASTHTPTPDFFTSFCSFDIKFLMQFSRFFRARDETSEKKASFIRHRGEEWSEHFSLTSWKLSTSLFIVSQILHPGWSNWTLCAKFFFEIKQSRRGEGKEKAFKWILYSKICHSKKGEQST